MFDINPDQRLVLDRLLGHSEVYLSHKWRKGNEGLCNVCNKLCYCIFVWNRRLQSEPGLAHTYYKHINFEPLQFTKFYEDYKHPVMYINGQEERMIPVMEFIERLELSDKQSVVKFRSCDNELEAKNYGIIKE